jgi:hypothetical protein
MLTLKVEDHVRWHWPKMFLDIPSAAELAGLSLRHFRRIMKRDCIPIIQIRRKFFILAGDLDNRKSIKSDKRI